MFSRYHNLTHCVHSHRNEALCTSIKTMESNPKIQSVILSSSNSKIFSAGLDISELISPNPDRLPKFWNSLQQLYLDLYGSRMATVAAIQGHAPAAGCFLAMACDFRIMSAGDSGDGGGDTKKKFVPTIGLNETQLGIAGECKGCLKSLACFMGMFDEIHNEATHSRSLRNSTSLDGSATREDSWISTGRTRISLGDALPTRPGTLHWSRR